MLTALHWTRFVGLGALALAGCRDDAPPPARREPPPPAAVKAATCEGGGGRIDDAASAPFFPRATGGFCLDPNGDTKAFGEGAKLPLERICDVFDGECEIYKGHGVSRVVDVRYVDGAGSPATIDIHFSKFATTEGAYAMLTQRIVGDGDAADEATPRPIEGGAVGALGLGNAYVWRGPYLAEITYNDESASESTMKSAGERLLPPLVKEIGAKLPGELALPPAAAALPSDGMIPLGVRFVTGDVLGVPGAGPGAFGYYRDGERRYRVVAIVREDAAQAKDVLGSFARWPGATREKGIGDGVVRAMVHGSDEAPAEWVFAQSGSRVLGVGDEVRVLRHGMTADEHAKLTLSKAEKSKRLEKAVAGGG